MHGLWQRFVEKAGVAGLVVLAQVSVMLRDFIEEAAEKFGVVGFLPQEGGQVHFLLNMSLLRDGHDERQQVERDTLFARLEERGQLQDGLLLLVRAALPVEYILRKIDAARVPDTQLFRLMIQAHGENIMTQSTLARRGKGLMNHLCHTRIGFLSV